MTRPGCPVLRDTRRAAQSGEELLRSLRRLRKSLLACQECPKFLGPGLEGCSLRGEFNLTIDSLVAEINEEWERSGWTRMQN